MSEYDDVRLRAEARKNILMGRELTPEQERAMTAFVSVSSNYREEDRRRNVKRGEYIRPFVILAGRKDQIATMRADGLSIAAIARQMDVSTTTMREYLICAGMLIVKPRAEK